MRVSVVPDGEVASLPTRGAPVLILGDGALALAFARLSHMRGLPYELLSPLKTALFSPAGFERQLKAHRPWAVVDATDGHDFEGIELRAARSRTQLEDPTAIATCCTQAGVRLLAFSTHFVFPGSDGAHYVEGDAVGPLSAYGRSKAEAEHAVLALAPDALVIRSAGLFGPWDDGNFIARGVALLRQGRPWAAASDHVLSPTYAPDLVQAALDLLIDGERGLWHLTNGEAVSWADLACRAAEHANLRTSGVYRRSSAELGPVAQRPSFSALHSERGMLLPSLDDALARYQHDHEPSDQADNVRSVRSYARLAGSPVKIGSDPGFT